MVGINIATTMPAFCGKLMPSVTNHHPLLLHDAIGALIIPLANRVEMMHYSALMYLAKSFKAGREGDKLTG